MNIFIAFLAFVMLAIYGELGMKAVLLFDIGLLILVSVYGAVKMLRGQNGTPIEYVFCQFCGLAVVKKEFNEKGDPTCQHQLV